MLMFAATATESQSQAGSLLVFCLFVGAWYAVACAVWPFRACRHCGGTGRLLSPTGRAWRACKHCRGTGSSLRAGRRIYAHLKETRDRTTRRPR